MLYIGELPDVNEFQGKNYNVITDDGTREYLGQKYFVFYLEATT